MLLRTSCSPVIRRRYFPVGPYKAIPVTEDILAATGGLAREAWYDGGVLRVRLEESRVLITGNAVLFMKGEIPFDL